MSRPFSFLLSSSSIRSCLPCCRTGSDDFSVCILNGVPFKFASQSRRHTRFVQSLDYAPSGELFASAGSDGQVLLYDGTAGEEKGALVDGTAAHEKGVFAASFSRDGISLISSSADGKAKLWDVASQKVVQEWNFDGDEVQKQQVVRPFPRFSSIFDLSSFSLIERATR